MDALHYLDGLKKLTFVNDIENYWNASYTFGDDEITIANQFHDKPFFNQVQIVLHEAGHRGQAIDPGTYKAYRAANLNKLNYFLVMANKVHRDDYKKNGISPRDMTEEIFAESYSRFALGMDMPEALRTFWLSRRAIQ
jgi:hypothetical protein